MHAQLLYLALFLLAFLLPSMLLGKLLMHAPRCLPAPRVARYLAGFCAAPLLLPAFGLASAVAPSTPRLLWVALPAIVAALGLVLVPGGTLGPLRRATVRSWRAAAIPAASVLLAWVAALAVLSMVLAVLINNAAYPVIGQDALKYANHALGFARSRELAELPSWSAGLGGNVLAGSHAISYQLLLSFALLATPEPGIGYPHDHALRMVAQVMVVYVFLGTCALGAMSRRPGAPALALLALLLAAALGYFSYAHSRDPFRIVALVPAVLALAAGSRRAAPGQLVLIAVLTALAVLAHTANVVYLACSVPALLALRARVHLRGAIARGLAAGLGAGVGGLHYAANAAQTGHLMGGISYHGYRGTELWQALVQQPRFVRAAALDLPERLTLAISGQGVALSVAGLVLATVFIVRWARRARSAELGAALGAAVLVAYLPLLGVFDRGGLLPLSWFFSSNPRYLAHAQPFAAALVALAIGELVARTGRMGRVVLPAAALALALAAVPIVNAAWDRVGRGALAFLLVAEEINGATRTARGVVLVDQDFRRYYLDGRTAYIGAPPAWPVLAAETPAAAGHWLADAGVSHVVLRAERIPGWWARLPLLSYLEGARDVSRQVLPLGSVVYTLPEPGAGR
jgi:hypothetical protein